MKIFPQKRLFWFLKDKVSVDLSVPAEQDSYVQQVLTHGKTEDIRLLFETVPREQFKTSFLRIRRFIPREVQKFWEDALANY